jgi:hypothetical protein
MTGCAEPNKNYGDSPVRRSSVPIASSLLRAARAHRRSQLRKRLASSARGTATRLPFGSAVESWPPQPSACPRPSPHAVPRADDASRERRRQPIESQRAAASNQIQRDARAALDAPPYLVHLVVGVARKKLSEHLTERCSRVQLREDSQPTQPDTMDQQIAGWQVQLHCYAA